MKKKRFKKVVIAAVLFCLTTNFNWFSNLHMSIISVEAATAPANQIVITNKKEQVEQFRKAALSREEKLVLKYYGSYKDLYEPDELWEEVIAINDLSTSTDHDYMSHFEDGFSVNIQYTKTEATLKYNISYLESKKETEYVDAQIKKVLKSLKIQDKSDYQKIKAIHDYIVNTVQYDTNYEKYTAFNAIIDKSSVCNGYAALTYKMLTEAKIPCRIVSGKSAKSGELHAWNIVKLQGKWYNLDTTWDDPVTSSGEPMLVYDYFLKNDKEFKDHIRDKEYLTKEFTKKYPIAKSSFTKAMDKGAK